MGSAGSRITGLGERRGVISHHAQDCPSSLKSMGLCMPLGRLSCKLKLLVQDGRYNLRRPNQNESQGSCLERQGTGAFSLVPEVMSPDEKAGTDVAMKELA